MENWRGACSAIPCRFRRQDALLHESCAFNNFLPRRKRTKSRSKSYISNAPRNEATQTLNSSMSRHPQLIQLKDGEGGAIQRSPQRSETVHTSLSFAKRSVAPVCSASPHWPAVSLPPPKKRISSATDSCGRSPQQVPDKYPTPPLCPSCPGCPGWASRGAFDVQCGTTVCAVPIEQTQGCAPRDVLQDSRSCPAPALRIPCLLLFLPCSKSLIDTPLAPHGRSPDVAGARMAFMFVVYFLTFYGTRLLSHSFAPPSPNSSLWYSC
jgi:hypothetical protein|mmetsp:Transcript_7357/g.14049  ORF Transcript_7357/g.14049 Transcript_7357/m.14049 type:complete len:266 (-) Transcript_7357:178-975(-)